MRTSTVTLLLAAVFTAVCQEQKVTAPSVEVVVQLKQGRIRGSKEITEGGCDYYTYLGIPFAKPPVGNLRFKDPVAAGGWKGVRDGCVQPQPCMQPSSRFDLMQGKAEILGSEDCLYLNVFTSQEPSHTVSGAGLPVMVFIHGGNFVRGNIKDYDPSPLLRRSVVVVTLQYRLGIHGFLSTDDEVLPGNFGLKDQTLALRWVQDNIDKFGGDTGRVTLFGLSAGSGSVHLQVLSPHATGLFQRVILQSGTALCPWVVADNHRELAFKLGLLVNCSAVNSSDLLACLTKMPYSNLTHAGYEMAEWNLMPRLAVPRVDGDFLPDHPAVLLKNGSFNNVDIISGITRDGGVLDALGTVIASKVAFENLKSNFSDLGPLALSFGSEESPEYLAHLALFRYLPHVNMTVNDLDEIIELFGDRNFKVCHEDTVEFHARANHTVYQYVLDHRGQHSFTDIFNVPFDLPYVSQGDDLLYLFDQFLPNVTLTQPKDLFVRRIMTELWTNFATTGNPTVNGTLGFRWTPRQPERRDGQPSFLSLSTKPMMMDTKKHNQDFWRNLPTKANKILFPERFLEE